MALVVFLFIISLFNVNYGLLVNEERQDIIKTFFLAILPYLDSSRVTTIFNLSEKWEIDQYQMDLLNEIFHLYEAHYFQIYFFQNYYPSKYSMFKEKDLIFSIDSISSFQ